MSHYCDPDVMLITETEFDNRIYSSEILSKCYIGDFSGDRNLSGGWIMVVTKDCYTSTDLVLPTVNQNETELICATKTLKDHYNLVVGSFTGPLTKRSAQIWNWKISHPRLQTPLRTTPKLLSFWW